MKLSNNFTGLLFKVEMISILLNRGGVLIKKKIINPVLILFQQNVFGKTLDFQTNPFDL